MAHACCTGIELPDQSLVDTLRAQLGYMLVNARARFCWRVPATTTARSSATDRHRGHPTADGYSGPAREYALVRGRHPPERPDFPILNGDGSVNHGVGSELEYDSQGEFVALVADVARLNGGAASVREYLPAVRGALQFLQTLRERTLVPGYQATSDAPQRFRGILAPSISHEGYPAPTHSYWDDYWALKGWHDGAWLARQWQLNDVARWATEQEAALRDSLGASIRATIDWKHIDYSGLG